MNKGEQLVADKYTDLGYEVIHDGVPDFLIFKDGKLSFVEVKSRGLTLSKSQERAHEILLRNGYEVKIETVRSLDTEKSMYIFEDEIPEFLRINKTKLNIKESYEQIMKQRDG